MRFSICLISNSGATFGSVTVNGQTPPTSGNLAAGDALVVGNSGQAVISVANHPPESDPEEVEHYLITMLGGSAITLPSSLSNALCEIEHNAGRIIVQEYQLAGGSSPSSVRIKRRARTYGGIGTAYSLMLGTTGGSEVESLSVMTDIVEEFTSAHQTNAGFTWTAGTESNTVFVPETEQTPASVASLINGYLDKWDGLTC